MKNILVIVIFLFGLTHAVCANHNSQTVCDIVKKDYPIGSLIECKIVKVMNSELCVQLPNGNQIRVTFDEKERTSKDFHSHFKTGALIPLYLIAIDSENGMIIVALKTDESRHIILLENEVLHIVDGNPLAINGTTIGMMLHLRSEIGKRRHGVKHEGKLTGIYTFQDKKYTMAELVTLETEWYANPTKENKEKISQLYQYMQNHIKEEFLKLTAPFLADARGAKGQMVVLITEWAQKAHRINSHLLNWAHTKESEEASALKSQIPTLKDFEQFCVDLVNFLESLMRSCPKACNQFKEILEQKQNHPK